MHERRFPIVIGVDLHLVWSIGPIVTGVGLGLIWSICQIWVTLW
jgi:hypothetical protein